MADSRSVRCFFDEPKARPSNYLHGSLPGGTAALEYLSVWASAAPTNTEFTSQSDRTVVLSSGVESSSALNNTA